MRPIPKPLPDAPLPPAPCPTEAAEPPFTAVKPPGLAYLPTASSFALPALRLPGVSPAADAVECPLINTGTDPAPLGDGVKIEELGGGIFFGLYGRSNLVVVVDGGAGVDVADATPGGCESPRA